MKGKQGKKGRREEEGTDHEGETGTEPFDCYFGDALIYLWPRWGGLANESVGVPEKWGCLQVTTRDDWSKGDEWIHRTMPVCLGSPELEPA